MEKEIQKNEEKYKWNYLQFNYPKHSFFLKKKYKNQFIIFISTKGLKNKIKRFPFLILSPLVSFLLNLRIFLISKKKGSFSFLLKGRALTGAYLIDKNTAKILLELTKKIVWPADITTSEKLYKYKSKNMNFYFYAPSITRQNKEFKSNIDKMENRK